MSGVRIRIEHGQDAGRTYRFSKSGVYVLGRHPSAALRLLDMKVSKGHCHIRVGNGNGTASLTDLGSTHGTLLNGNPVKDGAPLHPGDEIRLGMTILRVLSDGPADEEVVPSAEGAAEFTASEDLAATAAFRRPIGKPAEGPPRKAFPPDELVGKDLGGYRVLEKIGQGGMGAVYIAEQKSLNRKVALKVLSERLVKDAAFVDQFVNEARAAGQLNHPNVVQVYDVGQENGRYFFSMEYVSGGSLEDRIRAQGPADWRQALPWFIDAANAFIFAQRRGILHRDVKPDNLMVAEDGSAKLCDLGLAKKSEAQDLLQQGIIGTPHFISPEAIRRKKDVDARSDLYSLGCTFFRLLTGENPYGGAGKSVKDILMAHLKDPVPRISAKNPDVPKDLDDTVFRLMQKEPEERFASAEELFHALDRLRVQYGLEAHGIKTGSRKAVVIAILAVLAAGAVAGYFMLKPTESHERAQTPEQIARQKELEARAREAEKNRFEAFVANAAKALGDIMVRQPEKTPSQTWKDPAWAGIVRDFRALAKSLRENPEWGRHEEVEKIAKSADAEANAIEKKIETRRSVEKHVDQEEARVLGELRQAFARYKADFEKALAEKRWLAAEEMTKPETVESLLKPYREKKIGEVLPPEVQATAASLQNERLLTDKAIAEAVPEKPADWATQIEPAVRADHAAQTKEVADLAEPGTDEALTAAIGKEEAYLEKLPPADPRAAEGTVASLLQSFRAEVEKSRKEHERTVETNRRQAFAADRDTFFRLVIALRRPDQGMLQRLRLSDAEKRVAAAVHGAKTPAYRDAMLEQGEDVKAAAGLFDHARAAFEKGQWQNDKIAWNGEKGVKPKAVTAEGIVIGSETHFFTEMNLDWLLASFFYADEKTPRFAFAPEDHRGLAVLAEAAGRFDLAERHYHQYRAVAPPEVRTQNEIRDRLQHLADEKATYEAWSRILDTWRGVKEFLDAHDPALRGAGAAMTPDDRTALSDAARTENARKLAEAQNLLHQLETDPRFATTVWGTAIRRESQGPHPDARFVPNEPDPKPAAPAGGAGAPPKKEDGKPEPGADGAEKKGENPAPKDGAEGAKPGDAGGAKPDVKDGHE